MKKYAKRLKEYDKIDFDAKEVIDGMKKVYAKSLKEYDKPFELESAKILAATKKFKALKKKPRK